MPIVFQPSTTFTTTINDNSATANRSLSLPNVSGQIASIQNTTPSTTTLTSSHTANRTIALPDRNCQLTDGLQRGTAELLINRSIIDFAVPSYVKKITMSFASVASTTTGTAMMQLGTAAGIVTTGYASYVGAVGPGGSATYEVTNRIPVLADPGNLSIAYTYVIDANFQLFNITGNQWIITGVGVWDSSSTGFAAYNCVSRLSLSSLLTTVRVSTNNGTTFNTGTVNIFYE
jgi:hypothetical protein